jgi:hypothetical protein
MEVSSLAKPKCPCCGRGPLGKPQVHRSRVFSSLDEAHRNRSKPWKGDIGNNVLRFEGMQPQVSPKHSVHLFTHVDQDGCGSTNVRFIQLFNPERISR